MYLYRSECQAVIHAKYTPWWISSGFSGARKPSCQAFMSFGAFRGPLELLRVRISEYLMPTLFAYPRRISKALTRQDQVPFLLRIERFSLKLRPLHKSGPNRVTLLMYFAFSLRVQVPNQKVSTQNYDDGSSYGNPKYPRARYFGPLLG